MSGGTDPFAGARARLDRASEQIAALDGEFQAFSERADGVREILDPETGRKRLEYVVTEELPGAWPTIVGEIVYDLRSALDHAVYDLTCLETGGPLGQTGFPIFEDEDRFEELTTRGEPALGSGVFLIRGVNPYAKAAIRSLQPFEARKAAPFEEPMLSVLHALGVADRNRTIPLGRLRWPGSTIRSRRPVRELVFRWGATLEDGSVLAEWIPTALDGGRDVDAVVEFDVCFGEAAPTWSYAKHAPVVDVLEKIGAAAADTVRILEATVSLQPA